MRSLYLTRRFFVALAALATGFVVAFFLPVLLLPMQVALGLFSTFSLLDLLLLYAPGGNGAGHVFARRVLGDKLANGSDNDIAIYLENYYRFAIDAETIDEIPAQFQRRDVLFRSRLKAGETSIIRYQLRPVKRGEYHFGAVNVLVTSPIGLVRRRFRFGQEQLVPVYPSFLQMRQYELLAISNRLTEVGVKRIRRVGHSLEFEQVRPYVPGDDPRAINATLVVSNIALIKHDKAGLITFSDRLGAIVPADRRGGHLQKLLEVLYKQRTKYLETDFELLYTNVKAKIRQRSLLMLYTNFETLSGLQRQLPYLRRLAKDHLLLVIFFENTELRHYLSAPARTTEDVYNQTVAEKFAQEKRQIVRELQRYGIHALLTAPENLTVNTINRYLEFKARGLI